MASNLSAKRFRENGAVGALLDEYEKAIEELKAILRTVTQDELEKIVDWKTKNSNCRSIQTVLAHIVVFGFYYAAVIRERQGEKITHRKRKKQKTIAAYLEDLDAMFHYTVQTFEDYPKVKVVEKNNRKKIKVRWGQLFDVEQMMEHAICHVLRHRRQIERFLQKLR